MRLALCLVLIANPALGSSEEAWEAFRVMVQTTCAALIEDPGRVTVEVSPFGSESYGAALITVTAGTGTDRMICIVDKVTGRTELTAPFPD